MKIVKQIVIRFLLFSYALFLLSCNDKIENEKKVEVIESDQVSVKEKQIVSDTFSFENAFAESPFLLEEENLVSVKKILGDENEILISDPEDWDEFDDSLITISRDNSKIMAFNNNARQHTIIFNAEIADSFLIFKNNIKVGMNKDELVHSFKSLKTADLNANVFEIYSGEATSYVYLIFKNNVLIKVIFWPYVG